MSVLAALSPARWLFVLAVAALVLTGLAYAKGRADGYALRNAALVADYTAELNRLRDHARQEREAAEVLIAQLRATSVRVETRVQKVTEYVRIKMPDLRSCDIPADVLRERNALRRLTRHPALHPAGRIDGP